MGKAALLFIAASIIASSYYNLATNDGQAGAIQATAEHQLGVLARNAAMAGYDKAKQVVADAGSFDPFTAGRISFEGTYEGAHYKTVITSDGDVANILSIGAAANGMNKVSTSVEAVVGWASGPPSDVPPFLTYALITEENLLFNGNIGGYVVEQQSDLNANFHTNGNLHVNGNSADVAGFGTFAGTGTSNPHSALTGTFQPNYNPDDLETAYQSSPVEIPVFDSQLFFEDVSVDESSAGDVQLSGLIDKGGTREDPYVWHIAGDLTAVGGVTIEGYVMFVVEGNISLSGNLASGAGQNESSVALYAGDDVTLNGIVEIHGQIYAGRDVVFNGTPDIYGSVAARSAAVLNGSPGIHYIPASPALATIFPDESSMRLLSYYEH